MRIGEENGGPGVYGGKVEILIMESVIWIFLLAGVAAAGKIN